MVESYRNPQNFEHVEQQPTKQQPEVDKAGPPTTGATSAGSAPATGTTFDINHNKVPGKCVGKLFSEMIYIGKLLASFC